MKIIVLGADGYLGWPTCMHLAAAGHDVVAIDNHVKRRLEREVSGEPLVSPPMLLERTKIYRTETGRQIESLVFDVRDWAALRGVFRQFAPEAVVHFAEQPSGPYSMIGYDEARYTLENNLGTTLAVLWAIVECAPDCRLVKLGTMGEYGTPPVDIPEGWFDLRIGGRIAPKMLFPREAGSMYHTTKILDTDLIHYYVRHYGIAATDLMQGPVYGTETEETRLHPGLWTAFHYDDVFGTVLNRFVAEAAVGRPLTVYGAGDQTRGYIALADAVNCVRLACENPADPGELRVMNQITETFRVNALAEVVRLAGRNVAGVPPVSFERIKNPRIEAEKHYYNPTYSKLRDLGLEPHPLTPDSAAEMLRFVVARKDLVDRTKFDPKVRWPR